MSQESGPSAAAARRPARSPRRRAATGRSALLWGLAGFAAIQLGLVGIFERWGPGVREPQYGRKLTLLKRRLAAAPGRPLVLFMGTSRTLNGVQPAELPGVMDSETPVLFNFGHSGACPVQQIVLLRRLLRQGIHPDHIFLEILPALLCFDREGEMLVKCGSVCWQDWPAVKYYWPATEPRRQWYKDNLLPCAGYRDCLLERFFPWTLTKQALFHLEIWDHLDALGFLGCALEARRLTAAQRAKGLARAHQEYSYLLRDFHIAPTPDRAIRDFLRLCRKRQIGVTLLLMPEGKTYRSWYGPQADASLKTYLAVLRRDWGVEAIDARDWMSNEEDFADSHHLLPQGAEAFTRRLGLDPTYQRILAHLVSGSVVSGE